MKPSHEGHKSISKKLSQATIILTCKRRNGPNCCRPSTPREQSSSCKVGAIRAAAGGDAGERRRWQQRSGGVLPSIGVPAKNTARLHMQIDTPTTLYDSVVCMFRNKGDPHTWVTRMFPQRAIPAYDYRGAGGTKAAAWGTRRIHLSTYSSSDAIP